MTDQAKPATPSVRIERHFLRFTLAQRWEHVLLLVCFTLLLLTGLPQKYRHLEWSQILLSTPERVAAIRQIHHIAALLLTLEAFYHVGRAAYLIAKRRLPADMLVSLQDGRDAWQMLKYLLLLSKEKPRFGKYNFEQKITYWFLFFGIAILTVSGFIIWFPIIATRFLPGGVVPAAKLAHSTEAIVAAIFVFIWHFYHVHLQRLNLSIFTGRLNERDMQMHHAAEHERLLKSQPESQASSEEKA